jgi:hypothetical protein
MECGATGASFPPDRINDSLNWDALATEGDKISQQIARLGRNPTFLRDLFTPNTNPKCSQTFHADGMFVNDDIDLFFGQVLEHASRKALFTGFDQSPTDHPAAVAWSESWNTLAASIK